MSFQTGSISCRRFIVVGDAPQLDQAAMDKLIAHAFTLTELGIPEAVEYGWSGGQNVLDDQFSFDKNVYAHCLFFGLRIDSNKVPGDIRRAYRENEEKAVAAGNPSGFISKAQKRDVKETVQRKVEDDMRSGRFRRSRMIPILWDVHDSTLYAAASGQAMDMLCEIFERTFGCTLLAVSAGVLAMQRLEGNGERRAYEDLRPTRFVRGPEGEGQDPEYPWVAKGPEPKDFLGNEFLLWLWFQSEQSDEINIGTAHVALFVDRQLDLDCAYGQTGKDSIRGDGPGKSKEAREAVRVGKVPRRMHLLINLHKQDFSFTINAETLAISGAKLPDVEDAETPRVLFEERIGLLRHLHASIDRLFFKFLETPTRRWESTRAEFNKWISK